MLQLLSLLALLTQAIAAPQGGPTEPQGNSGSSNVHNVTVTVVDNTPQFIPTNVQAQQNDIVIFNFAGPVAHSVTQSSFNNPCSPLANGFNSGLQVSGAQFNVTVLDTSKTIWFYCQQTTPGKHCGLGMVGSINANNTGNTFDEFQSLAKSIGTQGEGPQTPATATTGVGATAALLVAPTGANSTGASNPSPTTPSTSTGTNNPGNKTNAADHLLPRDGMMVALVTFMGALAL